MKPLSNFLHPLLSAALGAAIVFLPAFASADSFGSNTYDGTGALRHGLSTAAYDSAFGVDALFSNTSGYYNTGLGFSALYSVTTAARNTAVGVFSLYKDVGERNTALGMYALFGVTSGTNNLGLGYEAGTDLSTGSNNIEIGTRGLQTDNATIRIGTLGTQNATYVAGINGAAIASGATVVIDTDGHLGTIVSSARFKEHISNMQEASEEIFALRPVSFQYRRDIDPTAVPQFGLVAEEVEKVDRALVVHDVEGKPYSVRYEAVNAMLLNEFLKEHQTVKTLQVTATEQQRQIQELRAIVDQQTSVIEKINASVKARNP